MKREIEIDRAVCHYIEYLHHSVMAYEGIIKDLITEIRGRININEDRFNKYCEDYKTKYVELETLKKEVFDEYFRQVYVEEIELAHTYSIDFINSILVVELGESYV